MQTKGLNVSESRVFTANAYVPPVLFVQRRLTDSSTQLFGDRKSGNAHSNLVSTFLRSRPEEAHLPGAALKPYLKSPVGSQQR